MLYIATITHKSRLNMLNATFSSWRISAHCAFKFGDLLNSNANGLNVNSKFFSIAPLPSNAVRMLLHIRWFLILDRIHLFFMLGLRLNSYSKSLKVSNMFLNVYPSTLSISVDSKSTSTPLIFQLILCPYSLFFM
jgi:hypothetical protein